MWIEDKNNPTKMTMVEGDYGIVNPIEIETDETISSSECFEISIYKKINTNPLVIKTYSNIQNKTINFSLTAAESALLPVGSYLYDINWYQGSSFLSCIAAKQKFMVVEKAGVVSDDDED